MLKQTLAAATLTILCAAPCIAATTDETTSNPFQSAFIYAPASEEFSLPLAPEPMPETEDSKQIHTSEIDISAPETISLPELKPNTKIMKLVKVDGEWKIVDQETYHGHEPFCVRHPKAYQKWRSIRKFCTVTCPIINWVGSAAQAADFLGRWMGWLK